MPGDFTATAFVEPVSWRESTVELNCTRYVCSEPVVMRYLDVPKQDVVSSQDTRPRVLTVQVVLAECRWWEERWVEEGKGGGYEIYQELK